MQRECAVCGVPFEAQRPTAKYCGRTCSSRATRARSAAGPSPQVPDAAPARGDSVLVDLVTAVTAELTAAGRSGSALGVQAVALARRMEQFDTGGGFAALSKELRAVMAAALSNASAVADPLDELRLRRDAKRVASG